MALIKTLIKTFLDCVRRETGIPIVKMDVKWSHAFVVL
jgi:hypothetical protein